MIDYFFVFCYNFSKGVINIKTILDKIEEMKNTKNYELYPLSIDQRIAIFHYVHIKYGIEPWKWYYAMEKAKLWSNEVIVKYEDDTIECIKQIKKYESVKE